jgi:molybdopterin-guanine dinucleotide biosynthesis protein A
MGTDKATLPYAGTTFLDFAITRLQKVCDDVAVSGNTDATHDLATIDDPVDHQGPAAGIAASLKYAQDMGFVACLITPVDTPALTVDDVHKLSVLWKRTSKLTIACTDRIEPLIGIYPIGLADSIRELSTSDDRSLYRWIAAQDYTALPFPPDHIHNINTPQDHSQHGCQ